MFIPEIQSSSVTVVPDAEHNALSVTVNYILKVSGNSDQITVEFI